jgi:uncharacterized protein
MQHYAQLLRAAVTASLMLAAIAGASVAGPLEDGEAAFKRGDYATALRLWRPLANQGDARAQYYLGAIYANGQGVPQDHAKALKWFRLGANQGDARAQYYLGATYANAEALQWFRLAAEQGDARAQYYLGAMYANGQGVPQDLVLAHMWFNLSAAGGYPEQVRDEIAGHMTPAQIAEAQKLAREWKPKR